MFTALMVQALLVLSVINAARKRRGKCDWQADKVKERMWLAIVGVVIGNVLPTLGPAQSGSPIAIFSIALMLYSVFILSRALYRKADLKKCAIPACFPTPPEQAGPQIIATFFTEYLPGVNGEYELLKKACEGPPKISLPDLQIEVLIFGLHCLDRAAFANYGAEYRDSLMDHALAFTEKGFSAACPEHLRGGFLERCRDRYNARQSEYATMPPLPKNDATPKNTLFWEYAKRICRDAGADPIVMPTLLEEAKAIFMMMNKVVQALRPAAPEIRTARMEA